MNSSPRVYIGDPKLVPRLKQYLDSNGKADVGSMVTHLQSAYSDYRRKKFNSLRISVQKACELLTEMSPNVTNGADGSATKDSTKSKSGDVSEESSYSSDGDYVEYQDQNVMNSRMTDLYKSALSNTSSPQQWQRMPTVSPLASSLPTPGQKGSSENRAESPFFIDKTGNRSASTVHTPKPMQQLGFIKKSTADAAGNAKRVPDWRAPLGDDSLQESASPIKADCAASALCSQKSLKRAQPPSSGSSSPVLAASATPASKRAAVDGDKGGPALVHAGGHASAMKQAAAKDTPKTAKNGGSVKKVNREVQYSSVKFSDVGGNEETIREVCKMLVHLRHPEVYEQIGVTPPRGFLLHGPPGCGKTLLAHAVAGELQLPFLKLAATEIVSGVSGESEERLRDVFDQAVAIAPCVLFIDEIDAITPKRETASKDMERRIVAQLLSCMDDLTSKASSHVLVIGATNRPDSIDAALRRAGRFDKEICLGIPDQGARLRILGVLCKSLRLDNSCDLSQLAKVTPGFVGADLMALTRDAAMVSVNRILDGIHAEESASAAAAAVAAVENAAMCLDTPILDTDSSVTTPLDIVDSGCVVVELTTVLSAPLELPTATTTAPLQVADRVLSAASAYVPDAMKCSEHVPPSLLSVVAWMKERPPLTPKQLEGLCITMADFEQALQHVQPSAKREGFATVPDVTWNDIGALHAVREELQMAVLAPIKYPEYFSTLGLTSPSGILLAGPPGCGKTLLAKAIANETGINFISVKGPELLNMYVGESERAVRQVFQRARNSVPCVIFFDELDALCPRRSDSGEGGASVRVVNQLLTEMDGLETRKQVFIMGATNRPDIIDPAILRPGRLDKILFVDVPSPDERLDILKTITKDGQKPCLDGVNLGQVAHSVHCNGFTGADLSALVREASLAALKDVISKAAEPGPLRIAVRTEHFDTAFTRVRPSVTLKDRALYDMLKHNLVTR